MLLREHTSLTLAALYVVVLGAVAIVLERRAAPNTGVHRKLADASTVYAIGALAWPFAWLAVCGRATQSMPWLAFVGLAWPPLLLLVDVAFAQHAAGDDPAKQTYALQMDGNTLSGLALALGGVLVKYVSDGFATASSPMLMAALLLVLLVVVPSPGLHADSAHASAFRAAQKVAVQYCLGLVITSVAIVFGVGMRHAGRQGAELARALKT